MDIDKKKLNEQIDEYIETIKDFIEYTKSEDFMGIILRGHLYIENELNTLIKNALINPDAIVLPYFSTKLDAAFSMGIIEERWYGAFKKLNKIRNKYAHDLGYEFTEKDYEDLVSTLSKEDKEEFMKDLKYKDLSFSLIKHFTGGKKRELSLKDKTIILLSNFFGYIKSQNQQIDLVLKEINVTKQVELLERQKEKFLKSLNKENKI